MQPYYLYPKIQFGEDRCTQFRVIVVTNPPTNTNRTDYNTLRHSLARSVNISWTVDEQQYNVDRIIIGAETVQNTSSGQQQVKLCGSVDISITFWGDLFPRPPGSMPLAT